MVRKLFITPPELPGENISRCLEIPASQEWLAVVNAAILLMTNAGLYEQLNETDLTPEAAAAAAYAMYERYLEGECGFMDCNDVLSCLPDIEQTIIDRGNIVNNRIDASDTTIFETRFPADDRANEILPPPVGCDLDTIFGGIREIITRIDATGQDFYEQLVSQSDSIERVADLIALLPLFGDLLGESMLLIVDNADTLKNGYEAYQTIDLVDEITCHFFELVCNECRYPTWDEIITYYTSLGISGIEDFAELSLNLMAELLIDSAAGSNQIIYYTTNAVLLFTRYLGGEVMGQTGRQFIELWATLGSDSPSNDHETLCPCEEETNEGPLTINWYDNIDWLGAQCAAGTAMAALYPGAQYLCALSLADDSGTSNGHAIRGLGSQQGNSNYRFDINVPFGEPYTVVDFRIRMRKQTYNYHNYCIKLFNGSTEVYSTGTIQMPQGTLYIAVDRFELDVVATSMSIGVGNDYSFYVDYIMLNRTV